MIALSLTLTATEQAGLEHVVAKSNAVNRTTTTAQEYILARLRGVLASYATEVQRDREERNRELIDAALSLPDADREEVKALIRSKLA